MGDKNKNNNNNKDRLLVGVFLLAIVIIINNILPWYFFVAVIFAITIYCSHEYNNILMHSRPLFFLFIIIFGLVLLLNYFSFYVFISLLYLNYFAWLLILLLISINAICKHSDIYINKFLQNRVVLFILGSLILIGFCFQLIYLRFFIYDGQILFLLLLFLVCINDSAAYYIGRYIGKNKIVYNISPGKTLEGFIGGGMVMLIAGILFSFYLVNIFSNKYIYFAILFGLVIFIPLGDLFESKLKRLVNIKDSGALLRSHGGLLDRCDSLFSATAFFSFIILIFN